MRTWAICTMRTKEASIRSFITKPVFTGMGIGLITLIIFKDILIGGHILWGSDFITTYLPYKQFLYEELQHHGSIPKWNPYLFGGIPFWGFFESTIFYPLDLPFWFVSPEKAYGVVIALHIFLGGLFMYALCRTLHLSSWAGFLAAMIFSFNNFIMPVVNLGRMVHAQSYCWTPLVLCLFARSFSSGRPYRMALSAGLCWGLQILAADPQTAFYTYGAITIFALVHADTFQNTRNLLRSLLFLMIVFLFGFGLSAVQVIPAMELVGLSTRGIHKSYDLVTMASFPPEGIITLGMPHFFGNLFEKNFWISGMPWSMPEFNLYIGIIPLLLVTLAKYRPIKVHRIALFCIGVGLLALILAFGKHTPVYRLAHLFPGFDSFRAPSKIIVLWMLAMSIMAGKGLDDLISDRFRFSRPIWIALLFTGLALVAGLGWFSCYPEGVLRVFSFFILEPKSPAHFSDAQSIIHEQYVRMSLFFVLSTTVLYLGVKRVLGKGIWIPLVALILISDVCLLNHRYVQTADSMYAHLKGLKNQLGLFFQKEKEVFRVGGVDAPYGPNTEMYLGLQTTAGAGPLILNRYYTLCNHFSSEEMPQGWLVKFYAMSFNKKILDMLNIKYDIIYRQKQIIPRRTALPRALLVSGCRALPSEKVLPFMASDAFHPRHTVVFEDSAFPRPLKGKNPAITPGDPGTCRIIDYRSDEILIRADVTRDCFLVLHDIYYPGWKCYVNDRLVPVYRCNYLLRAIPVKRGKHEVRFLFDPPLVKAGTAISLITLVFAGIACIYRWLPVLKDRPRRWDSNDNHRNER